MCDAWIGLGINRVTNFVINHIPYSLNFQGLKFCGSLNFTRKSNFSRIKILWTGYPLYG